MTRNEQLAAVIRLACLTEDRTDAEQRALTAWAWDCDRLHNRNTVTNRARRDPNWKPQDLVTLVILSRDTSDGGRAIGPPNRWSETWAAWTKEWVNA